MSYWIKKILKVWKRDGFIGLLKKIKDKLYKNLVLFPAWIKANEPDEAALAKQRKEQSEFAIRPTFAIVVPLYFTKIRYLDEMIESVRAQTYDNWQLCLADASVRKSDEKRSATGAGENTADERESVAANSPLTEHIKTWQKRDNRIRYTLLSENKGIAENTNAAMQLADISDDDFFVFIDHDDTISPDALYEFAKAIQEDEEIDVLYSDQDLIAEKSGKRRGALWKPDFNIDLLCSFNYISHLFAARKSLADKVGWLKKEYDGSQDYDFTLRTVEQARKIYHVPKLLYHWRESPSSVARDPHNKDYAYEAGKRAIEAHYKRFKIPATIEYTETPGQYRTVYHWEETPLISVVIPNKDHIEDLAKCVTSLEEKSTYREFEIIIVENNSEDAETFAGYDNLCRRYENIRVATYEGAFDYAAINNFGVKETKGDYLLLLNNDTEMIDGNLLSEMLGYCMRPDVGVVGARLFYPDHTIQHAGVIIGYGGVAGHAFLEYPETDPGDLCRIFLAQDYSAVTGACLMTKRKTFDEVGGLSPDLKISLNDVDYCLKVRLKGQLVVYNPYAKAIHYESKSRGYEDTPEKQARFEREKAIFRARWADLLAAGDPYYNPNLTLDSGDFSLKKPEKKPQRR